PQNSEPRTGLSMGAHAAITAREMGVTREDQDELAATRHRNLAAPYDSGFQDDLVTPSLGMARDNNMRPDPTAETLATLKPRLGRAAGQRGVGRGEQAPGPRLPRGLRDRRGRLRPRP